MEFESHAFSMGILLNSVTSNLKMNADDKGISLKISVSEAAHGDYIGDSLRIRQVLFNLLGNAVKFTSQGGVSLAIVKTDQGLRFEVRDSGIGIAAEAQQKLFTQFTQVDASTSRQFGGTGLGLVICKKLVEGMYGKIGVYSQSGQGSLFWFELPLKVAAKDASIAKVMPLPVLVSDSQPATAALPAPFIAAQKAQILLVEDHFINQKLALALLTQQGFEVELAKDGAEAVDAAQQRKYQVILMDVQMPVMNGFEATRAIRSGSGPNAATPIIALTANAMQSDKDACFDAGMDDFLTKPFNKGGLAAVLKRQLARGL